MSDTIIDWNNLSRLNVIVQKREYAPSSPQATFCGCAHPKVRLNNCPDARIRKGEYIFSLKLRVNTTKTGGETRIWYTTSRWRIACLARAAELDGRALASTWQQEEQTKAQNRATRLARLKPPKQKPGPKNPKLSALSPEEKRDRETWQKRISSYKSKLKKYESRPNPSMTTIRAINNCNDQILHYQTLLKYQNTRHNITDNPLDHIIINPALVTPLLDEVNPDIYLPPSIPPEEEFQIPLWDEYREPAPPTPPESSYDYVEWLDSLSHP